MSSWQQLERLGSRCSYWADRVNPATGGVCLGHVDIFLLMELLLSQGGEWDEAVSVGVSALSGWYLYVQPYICI